MIGIVFDGETVCDREIADVVSLERLSPALAINLVFGQVQVRTPSRKHHMTGAGQPSVSPYPAPPDC
jgi:hypothetical protein